MLIKSLIATAAVALAVTAALPANKAEAKTNVDINLGIGFGGYGYVDPGYGGYETVYVDEGISCSKAKKIVRWNGFQNVKSLDCSAPNYRFSGWRYGEKYSIKVNSWGEITRISAY